MKILDPQCTARDAANRFAFIHFDPPRHVGQWDGSYGDLRFKLVDGVKWYRVVLLGSIGWEIIDAE